MTVSFTAPLVPIIVAVTGHRDLRSEEAPVLASAVTGQLRLLSSRYPHSPCLLLTGLAEGADRLAARCALEAGWQLGVVLPLPQAVYEQDFGDQESIEDFRSLIHQASWCRDISSPGMGRPQCYDRLGQWLYQHSHALLALWDGEPSTGLGGTAEVVRLFREELTSGHDRLGAPDPCPVIHVHTGRASSPPSGQTGRCGSVEYLLPMHGGMPLRTQLVDWHAALMCIEQFNQDVVRAQQKGLLADLQDPLALPSAAEGGSPAENSAGVSAHSLFLVSDRMAMHAQRGRTAMFKGLLLLAGCALVLAQTYSSLFTLPMLLWSAIILSCVGVAWYRVSESRHIEQRYLDYRALAEACKVQYFWQIAGVADSVLAHYLWDRSGQLEWIRLALRTTTFGAPTTLACPVRQRLKWVRDNWLEDQRGYFLGSANGRAGKAAQNRRLNEVWSGRSRALAIAGAALMVFTAAFHLFIADLTISAHDWLLKGLIVSYSVVFGAAGLCKVYQQTSAFSEHARKYECTGQMLRIAISQVDTALEVGDEAKAMATIRSFGIKALDENGDWLLLHRERPVSAQGFG